MHTRSKLIAAVLGLVVAAGAIGDASATTVAKKTIVKTVKPHAVVTKTRIVAHKPIIKHVRMAHRAPVAVKKIVRVSKRPVSLQKQAFAHRLVVKKTVIR